MIINHGIVDTVHKKDGRHIGNHVTIGAGAVVNMDVPDNCTVTGNPAYIVKKDGQNCKIALSYE